MFNNKKHPNGVPFLEGNTNCSALKRYLDHGALLGKHRQGPKPSASFLETLQIIQGSLCLLLFPCWNPWRPCCPLLGIWKDPQGPSRATSGNSLVFASSTCKNTHGAQAKRAFSKTSGFVQDESAVSRCLGVDGLHGLRYNSHLPHRVEEHCKDRRIFFYVISGRPKVKAVLKPLCT